MEHWSKKNNRRYLGADSITLETIRYQGLIFLSLRPSYRSNDKIYSRIELQKLENPLPAPTVEPLARDKCVELIALGLWFQFVFRLPVYN